MKDYEIKSNGSVLSLKNKEMLVKYHYLKTWRSLFQKEFFELYKDKKLVGLAVFGLPASRQVTKKYVKSALDYQDLVKIGDLKIIKQQKKDRYYYGF
jgi:hypothetical protein